MRLASLLIGLAAGLAAFPALAQTAPQTIMQGGFPSTPTIMQGGFPSTPTIIQSGFRGSMSGAFTRPFFLPGMHHLFFPGMHHRLGGAFFHNRFGGTGVGRFWSTFQPYGYGYGYGGGYGYGDGYGYDNGGAVADQAASPNQPIVMLNAAPPPPPPVSLGVTTETTPAGVTIVRGHTQY
jgi:hypothetical protein